MSNQLNVRLIYSYQSGEFTIRPFYFCFLLFFLLTDVAESEDFQTPHRLEPGQTLSADILNEIFDSLASSEKIPTRDDFLGTWQCQRTLLSVEAPYSSSSFEQGMIHLISGSLEFATDGSSNYTVSEQHPEILVYPMHTSDMVDEKYATLNGYLYMEYNEVDPSDPQSAYHSTLRMKVLFRGDNQFELSNSESFQTGSSIICDKTEIPPHIATLESAVLTGTDVLLTWTDRSEDETGFVLLRRDSLDGQWTQIGQVGQVSGSESSATYTDPSLTPGTYWYRVQSVNNHGASLGSNVLSVTIQ